MFKKIFSYLLVATLLVTTFLNGFTTNKLAHANTQETKSVTLHKLMMTKDELAAWDWQDVQNKGYNGSQDLAGLNQLLGGKTVKEIAGVYFVWEKNFGNEQQPDWKPIKADGSQTTLEDPTVLGGFTTDTGYKFNTSSLPNGKYRISEITDKTTYVGTDGAEITDSKAVPVEIELPLVNADGVIVDGHVYPKNTEDKPRIDKNFADSVADATTTPGGAKYENYRKDKDTISRTVGNVIPYNVKTEIPQNARYKTLIWEDTMTEGLTYNKDLRITSPTAGVTFDTNDYTLVQNDSGFVLQFTNAGLTKVENAAKNGVVEIELNYNATLNGNAIVDNPEENNITFNYGNKPRRYEDPRNNDVPPKDNEVKVKKTWGTNGTDQAPQGVTVKYFLYEKGQTEGADKVVQSVTLTGPYDHIFSGLDNNKRYYVKEVVLGYTPEYTKVENDGTINVRNDKDPNNPPPLVPTTPKVVTGGKRFQKIDEISRNALKGAEFVVKQGNQYLKLKDATQIAKEQEAYDRAEKEYQDALKAGNQDPNLKAKRDAAYQTVNTQWDWTTNVGDAHKVTSAENGYFHITGLAYGNYELEEVTPPTGYAKLNSAVPFAVVAGSITTDTINAQPVDNQINGIQLVNNKKITIPQTGGIGTTIFSVLGLGLMAFAFIAMKRRRDEEEA